MTPSEIYANNFQIKEPSYYTRMPNIIDHLTYQVEENGIKKSKRLSVYAKELYRVIRMIAFDDGADWHTTEHLAEIIGCSVGSICNAKEELLNKFDQLDGNPLIIENRKPVQRMVNGKIFKTVLCTRTIVFIWSWNNAFMATLKYQNKLGRAPDSCGESANPPDSCSESVPKGPDSCGEGNNNPLNKNPLSKEQQPTATPIVASSNAKERLFPSEDKKKIYDYLIKEGCHEVTAHKISVIYSLDEFQKAIEYTNTMNKKTQKANRWGYLQSVLKNKYWEKKNG